MRKLEYVDFTVRGAGPFPTDMLRFDECWPTDIYAGLAITNSIDATANIAEITMRAVQSGSGSRPTVKRWESFGWKVTKIDDQVQEPSTSARNRALEEALSWTFQHGYIHGLRAAEAYAELAGCAFRIHDGGLHADWLTFFDDEAAAVAAENASRFTYRKPEAVR